MGHERHDMYEVEGKQEGHKPRMSREQRSCITETLKKTHPDTDKVRFPFLIAICGSGFLFLKVTSTFTMFITDYHFKTL